MVPKHRQLRSYYDAIQPGLVLRVNSGGRKTWCALWYKKGLDKKGKRISVPTTTTLDVYPTLKVKEARDKARKFLVDPSRATAQADSGSFREVAENSSSATSTRTRTARPVAVQGRYRAYPQEVHLPGLGAPYFPRPEAQRRHRAAGQDRGQARGAA